MRILLILALLFPLSANAADSKPFKATYNLLAGGVRMIKVDANFDLNPKTYAVRTDARTTGMFEKILPWSGTFSTNGEGTYKPLRHDYDVRWRNNSQVGVFTYKPAGVFETMTQTENGKPKGEDVDLEIAKDTTDLLSASLIMFNAYEKNGSCTVDVPAFDNARSFIIRFKDAGDAVMNNPKVSSYTGPAHGCSVEIIPQKGKWPKKPRGWLRIQQQAKQGGKLPILWVAKPKPELPVIPVRVDIHTKYGDVIAHITGVQ